MDRIEQLRYRLISSGVDVATSDDIINSALNKIQSKMVSSLDSGVNLAFEESVKMRANDFAKDIRVTFSSRGLEIDSAKGSLDYSSPPYPMMDRLLAKGKTAKDGSVYRVIPIGASSIKKISSLDTSSASDDARSLEPKKSLTEMSRQMAQAFNSGMKVSTSETKTKSNNVSFRTVSNKQDSGAWTFPARPADLSPAVSSINAMMRSDFDRAVDEVMEEIESEVLYAIRDV
jgi:hypothetical protein